jgi:hypothetical protein
MVLIHKIKASSIAEIVVALAVISICFGISSLVFIRTTGSGKRMIDLEKQTALQSLVFEKLSMGDIRLNEVMQDDIEVNSTDDPLHDSLLVISYTTFDNKVLFTCSGIRNKWYSRSSE